ncbi:MAG: hypothetical protein Q4D16_08415 [Eubacteriales bacterium]|nr:hypothetical protein [Eubacteriales bacterium]
MRIIVRAKGVNLWIPVPLCLASAAVSLMPESAFLEMRKSVAPPYDELITKEFLREIVRECRFVLKQYKGLEMIHVEAHDGTYVSVTI